MSDKEAAAALSTRFGTRFGGDRDSGGTAIGKEQEPALLDVLREILMGKGCGDKKPPVEAIDTTANL